MLRSHRLHRRLLYDARLQLKVAKTVGRTVQVKCGFKSNPRYFCPTLYSNDNFQFLLQDFFHRLQCMI